MEHKGGMLASKSLSAEEPTSLPFTVHCELITWSHLAAMSVTGIPWPRSHFPAPPVYYGMGKNIFWWAVSHLYK